MNCPKCGHVLEAASKDCDCCAKVPTVRVRPHPKPAARLALVANSLALLAFACTGVIGGAGYPLAIALAAAGALVAIALMVKYETLSGVGPLLAAVFAPTAGVVAFMIGQLLRSGLVGR